MVIMLDKSLRKPHDRLADELAGDLAEVNTLIRARMASEHAPRIPEVTAHLVEAGGKRLRPMLTLAAARMCGYAGANHLKLAATVEFIHTATLLHDDVVDESAKRRGRPTANLLWDNKSSVLVGDYLFARSFQLMVETGNLRVLDILSNAAATIAEGEVLQLSAAQDLRTTEDIYLQVVRGKTAALFSAATEVGGVIAGMDDSRVQALFDYWGSDATGKNVGDDFRERKLTLPVIKAVALADETERAFWQRTIAKGKQEDGDLERAWHFGRHARRSKCLDRQGPQVVGDAARPSNQGHAGRSGRLRGGTGQLTRGRAAVNWSARTQPATHQSGYVSYSLRAASFAAVSVSNKPKHVAPEPDMRASPQPSWAPSTSSTSAMAGCTVRAGGSRSLRISPSQSISAAASANSGMLSGIGGLVFDPSALNTDGVDRGRLGLTSTA